MIGTWNARAEEREEGAVRNRKRQALEDGMAPKCLLTLSMVIDAIVVIPS